MPGLLFCEVIRKDYLSTPGVVMLDGSLYLMTVEAQLHTDLTKAPAFVA